MKVIALNKSMLLSDPHDGTFVNSDYLTDALALIRLADIPIERHIKVKGTASPDDSQLGSYWKKRQTRYGKTYWEKGSKLYQVAASQSWQCPVCGEPLFNGEQLHTHHLVRVAEGGTNFEENLTHLHKACHQHLHSGRCSELQKA
jgi:RNA-directed DNA polymerase